MHKARCYCDVRVISIRNSSWVEELNGVSRPFCTTQCHRRFVERQAERLEAIRYADEVATHIHSKGAFDVV